MKYNYIILVIGLAGNKNDLIDEEKVSKEDAQNFARDIGAIFKYTSAKTGEGIEDLFKDICLKYCQKNNIDFNNNTIKTYINQTVTPTPSSCEILKEKNYKV